MLNVEQAVDYFIIEEGQVLLGLDFLLNTLGFTMKQFEKVFEKTVKEYGRRRPLKSTEIMYGNSAGMIQMPESTMSVRATRYGVLPEYPRYFMDEFGEKGYEYTPQTKILRVYPPITPIKVTYTHGYTITANADNVTRFNVFAGDTDLVDELPITPRKNSLKITVDDYELKEVRRETVEVEMEGATYAQELAILEGTLGHGTYNTATKELEITFDENIEITEDTQMKCEYKSQYKCVEEIDEGDYVFTKFFCSKMLEMVASARAQATQANVHSIDLTEDQLYVRARILKKEVVNLLSQTWDSGAVADI